MNKLCVLFVIAIFTNGAFAQQGENNNKKEDLDDRYGFLPPWFPGMIPSQNQFPGPNPFPGQNPFPEQNPFPGQNLFPGQDGRTTTLATTTTTAATGSTTQSPAVRDCIVRCPVTPEYNPVCGTDNITYDNPGRLNCAQLCGINVNLQRTSRCPAAQPSK